ncbi:DUF2075 domain-containing protein [Spirillospora sp. NPDC029432]|uniref:DUF2075 domain-containing protein n=1 Tax=Spirillospora sp. NPDC029432 TaxID=3154599 RepID=UPI0034571C5A
MTVAPQPAYRASAENLYKDLSNPDSAAERAFVDALTENLKKKAQSSRKVTRAQKLAWQNSLTALVHTIVDAGLGGIEVLVEYPMPHQKNSQADVVLAGVDRHSGGDIFLVVELKQWESVEFYNGDEHQVQWDRRRKPVEHPADQVAGYRDQIFAFCQAVESHPDSVRGLVFMHNMAAHEAAKLHGLADELDVGLFTQSDRDDLIRHLRGRFSPAGGTAAADRLLNSRIKLRRGFIEQAVEALNGRDGFNLLDRQIAAYRAVLHAVEEAHRAPTKRVIVISGGPGTGKSAIALELLKALLARGREVRHATGSSAFTKTLRARVARGKEQQQLFTYFSDYGVPSEHDLDVLIADEAHRARSKTFNRWQQEKKSDRPQIETMIESAHVPVFLLDENQTVGRGELGTISAIKSHAQSLSIPFQHIPLTGQWRYGGSIAYDQWVRRLLGLGDEDGAWDEDKPPAPWQGDPDFAVVLADSPAEMETLLRSKMDAGASARIVAGYCWPWSAPRPDGTLEPEVVIGDWARPWNAKSDSRVGDAPPRALWATAPGGFEQVGCVYTAQGLEFDWTGVIIGEDLVARRGRLVPEREKNKDPELGQRKVRTLPEEEFRRLLRNIYKVLLTRSLRGVVIHAVDTETQELLRSLIPPHSVAASGPVEQP